MNEKTKIFPFKEINKTSKIVKLENGKYARIERKSVEYKP
jgi:ribosomal protein L33